MAITSLQRNGVYDHVRSLAKSGGGSRLVAGSNLSSEVLKSLSRPASLGAVATSVAQVAEDRDVDALVGASQGGEWIAVAAVMQANNSLHLYERGDHRVLVVDAVAVTGAGIARSAAKLRHSGVAEVFAVVVYDARENRNLIPGLSGLDAIRAVDDTLPSAEASNRC